MTLCINQEQGMTLCIKSRAWNDIVHKIKSKVHKSRARNDIVHKSRARNDIVHKIKSKE